MNGHQAAMLPDGRRLHLHHGPIDLIVEAWGAPDAVAAAYAAAEARFATILGELVAELPLLRSPCAVPGEAQPRKGDPVADSGAERLDPLPLRRMRASGRGMQRGGGSITGPVALRMEAAARAHLPGFVTPMIAVAGAVADAVLAALVAGRTLTRAYVNNGGDIAFHLEPGQNLSAAIAAAAGLPDRVTVTHADPSRGLATSGWRGRSWSLGIADAVTVLAATAAEADAAATLIANAVDLPGHPAIRREPVSLHDPDSDLGDRLATVDVGPLTPAETAAALATGLTRAEAMRARGLIHAAALFLNGQVLAMGAGICIPRRAEGAGRGPMRGALDIGNRSFETPAFAGSSG